jgi:hypothetical protein
MARDNFSQTTARILAERVGFLCSNPKCRNFTVGPNETKNKSTRIGEAAHISAASAGGPRYDENLTTVERTDIDNGVWLCSNCADLIDKDPDNYSQELIRKWKADAEYEMYEKIKGLSKHQLNGKGPYLEVDLRYNSSGRTNLGYSNKNPVENDERGNPVMVINFGMKPIIHWKLDWEYTLFIYNNSSYPAFNINVEPDSENQFLRLTELPKINNLQPMGKLELSAEYEDFIESSHEKPDEILKNRVPDALNNLRLKISYLDESRNEHITIVTIKGQELINEKL